MRHDLLPGPRLGYMHMQKLAFTSILLLASSGASLSAARPQLGPTPLGPSLRPSPTSDPALPPESVHAWTSTEAGWRAVHVYQGWTSEFDTGTRAPGLRLEPHAGDWTWGWDLARWGREQAWVEPRGFGATRSSGSRLEFDRSAELTEWFINGACGLEQGFTLSARPPGLGDLILELESTGDLEPRATQDTDVIEFLDAGGEPRLTYSKLRVQDAAGLPVSAWMEAEEGVVRIVVEDLGHAYPLEVDPLISLAHLTGFNPDATDNYGWAVALDGDTLAVGNPRHDGGAAGVGGDPAQPGAPSSGSVFMYDRLGPAWVFDTLIKASNADASARFGWSLDLEGDRLVVGAPGEASNLTGSIPGSPDLSQTPNVSSGFGAAYVFERIAGDWEQEYYLKPSVLSSGDEFGTSVAISGSTLAVGAPFENRTGAGASADPQAPFGADSGAVFVFDDLGSFGSSDWQESAYIKSPGNTAFGEKDQFGHKVSLNGDLLAVSAPFEDSAASGVAPLGSIGGSVFNNDLVDSGAVFTFDRSGGAWVLDSYFKAAQPGADDRFGSGLDLDTERMIVGAPLEDGGEQGVAPDPGVNTSVDSGAAYLFRRQAGAWFQEAYLKGIDASAGDGFGYAVRLEQRVAVVGSPYHDGGNEFIAPGLWSTNNSGAANVYVSDGQSWVENALVKPTFLSNNAWSGWSLGIENDFLCLGAPNENFGGQGDGGVQLFDLGLFEIMEGCSDENPAVLSPGGPGFPGSSFEFVVNWELFPEGTSLLYLGPRVSSPYSCGLPLGGGVAAHIAVSPLPELLDITAMSGGVASFTVPIPNDASLVGQAPTLQAAVLPNNPLPFQPYDLSDGLEILIVSF